MKFGVVQFTGANCDEDAWRAARLMGHEAVYLWHKEPDIKGCDVIILPGGFSYGDYLRPGAIARFSPVMQEVIAHAKRGGTVLAICNGFQIACEAGLLPGVLLRNASLRFVSAPVHLRVESIATRFTASYRLNQVIQVPIAHGDGRYFADGDTLERLEGEGRVVFRYVDRDGNATDASNPNGSMRNIAGIINEQGNVLGMMPHPERALENILGSTDGIPLFESLLTTMTAGAGA